MKAVIDYQLVTTTMLIESERDGEEMIRGIEQAIAEARRRKHWPASLVVSPVGLVDDIAKQEAIDALAQCEQAPNASKQTVVLLRPKPVDSMDTVVLRALRNGR